MTACLIFSKIPTLLERRYSKLTDSPRTPGVDAMMIVGVSCTLAF